MPPLRSLRPESICDNVKHSVVMVGFLYNCGRCEKWLVNVAGGFVVTSDGVIAANHHVMQNKEDKILGVMTFDGQVVGIEEVLAANENDDAALIRVDARGLRPLPLRPDAPVGSSVRVLSHPREAAVHLHPRAMLDG